MLRRGLESIGMRAFAALAGCALTACATTEGSSQVISVPTGDAQVRAETVFTDGAMDEAHRVELRDADLSSNWLCEHHPALVQRMSRHPVASCRSYGYVVELGKRRETMHDLVIETTEEVAEEYHILFRLVDPIADIFIDDSEKASGLLRFESVKSDSGTFFVIISFRQDDQKNGR